MDQNLDNQFVNQPSSNSEDNSQIGAKISESTTHVHGPNCSHGHGHHVQDPIVRAEAKVGRNDLCPCGSQQKFKKCHGN